MAGNDSEEIQRRGRFRLGLCGEEGFVDAGADFRSHAVAGVGDGDRTPAERLAG